ncbi:MAG: flagellar assembly protein FliW [Desulfobacteraceae bacterium]|nr:MAG: flagellar assembly protein FliW [Desulfobacteraceae bacterium]
MQRVQTSRFGTVEVDEHRMIHFPEGLLGFPEHKEFVLLEDKPDSPFFWLQSLSDPELAFVLTNPFFFREDYLHALSREEKSLFMNEQGEEMVLLTLVSIPAGHPEDACTNLLGPLVIDPARRTGRQLILPGTGYSHHYPLTKRTSP